MSGDSDLFIYQYVTVVWRPACYGGFLEYQKSAVLSALGFKSAERLTALGVVSSNDYDHSVYGLGCETNYKTVKDINAKGSDEGSVTFDTSINVFVHLKQTPIAPGHHDEPDAASLEMRLKDIKERFKDACGKFAEQNRAQLASRQATRRHRPSQKFNRYRTIDRPPPKKSKDSITEPLPRPRYSVKTRKKTVVHEPPKELTRYKWKPWAKQPESPLEKESTPEPKPTKKPSKKPKKPPTPIESMDKKGLLKELA
ncbi:hypothetical protein BGZ80_008295 [Entomortierella chlamydospora]|uniref:Uncharacterized protein n=1 Tax=Entomortierella chlamydospora TaxID=101097 RepID=A0A9P6MYU0_9FUNG|nr:hypothetical protein BGZ80_008295 [Entomortierella chlamydospora]